MRKIEKNVGLGKRIKAIRLQLGKSQTEFGEMFDPPAPKGAVSRWEHGGGPNKKRLKKIAELGNVSVEYLINGNDTTNEDAKRFFHKVISKKNLSKTEREQLWELVLEAQYTSRIVEELENKKVNKRIKNGLEQFNSLAVEKPTVAPVLRESLANFLELLNLIVGSGKVDQAISFSAMVNILKLIAYGSMEYDADDTLPNIDKLLSSFPIKNSSESKE